MGCAHGGEDRPRHRVRAAPRGAGVLVHRLRRGPHHRPGRSVPRAARRGPDLLQPDQAVGQGAPDLLPVRTLSGGRRLHPRVLRRRDHGRGQRVHVPRVPAHGRGGDRRTGDARGDGRRPHARHRVGLRGQPRRRRRRRDRAGPPAVLLPARLLAPLPRTPSPPSRRRAPSTAATSPARRQPATTCTA